MRRAKSPLMERIEADKGRTIEDLIRDGVEAGRTHEEIASSLKVSVFTLRSWLYRLGAQSTVRFRSDEMSEVSR